MGKPEPLADFISHDLASALLLANSSSYIFFPAKDFSYRKDKRETRDKKIKTRNAENGKLVKYTQFKNIRSNLLKGKKKKKKNPHQKTLTRNASCFYNEETHDLNFL